MSNEDLQQIQSLVAAARKVLVLTHANPSVDTMASCLAISLAFQKMGKDVTVAMESQPLVEVANLVGVDKVQTSFSGNNLVLTYKPYNLGDFEKVTALENPSANSDGQDTFTMTVIAKNGVVPDPKNFTFSYVGSTTTDLLITVEVLEPTQIGALYDQTLFASAPIINIDNHDPNKDYGKFNLVEPDAASVSEIVTFFLRAVNAQLDPDIAHNLYEGIKNATANFQNPKVAAATFEAAAICIRASKAVPPSNQPVQPPVQPVNPRPQPISPQPITPQTANTSVPQNGGPVPQDWTQPKIFRGGGSMV